MRRVRVNPNAVDVDEHEMEKQLTCTGRRAAQQGAANRAIEQLC